MKNIRLIETKHSIVIEVTDTGKTYSFKMVNNVMKSENFIFGKPLKTGAKIINKKSLAIKENESLLYFALEKLGFRNSPFISTGVNKMSFSKGIAKEINKELFAGNI